MNQMLNLINSNFFSTLFGAIIGGGITVWLSYKTKMKELKIQERIKAVNDILNLITKMEFKINSTENYVYALNSCDEDEKEEIIENINVLEEEYTLFKRNFAIYAKLYCRVLSKKVNEKIAEIVESFNTSIIDLFPDDKPDVYEIHYEEKFLPFKDKLIYIKQLLIDDVYHNIK